MTIASDNRSKPTLDEITVLDRLVRLLKNLPNLELDRLQVGLEQSDVRVGQCGQEFIFKSVWRGGDHALTSLRARAHQISLSRLQPGCGRPW